MYSEDLLGDQYQHIRLLGEGAFGKVSLYRKIKSKPRTFILDVIRERKMMQEDDNEYFAMKKFNSPISAELGLDHTTLRELKYLISLDHPHIIKGKGAIFSKKENKPNIYLILDYMLELHEVLRQVPELYKNQHNLKVIAYHILLGLNFLHRNMILHRDLKPENIFITKKGVVVIADFGFSREFGSPNKKLSTNVCTIEYRAPEIFFGTAYYSEKADIWSFGCILAFLFTRETLFPSSSGNELQTLKKIFYLCGTPNQQIWPDFNKFPCYMKFEPQIKPKSIMNQLKIPQEVASIIQKCLQLDPRRRPSTAELLQQPFFSGLENMNLDVNDFYNRKLSQLSGGN